MKKVFLLLLLIPFCSFSQIDSLRISNMAFEESIVNIEGAKASDLYVKLKNWVQKYYKNPNVVLKSEIENEYLRIDGSSNFSFKWMGTQTYNYTYSLGLSVKDGKYKVELTNVKMDSYSLPNFFYDKKGKRKTQRVNVDMYNSFLADINKIHFDLYNYIINKESNW